MRTLIVSNPIGSEGMPVQLNLDELRKRSEIEHLVVDRISESDLAQACVGYDYLMLNIETIWKLTGSMYDVVGNDRLRGISLDTADCDWTAPKKARAAGIDIMGTGKYATDTVAEQYLFEMFLHSRRGHLAYNDRVAGRQPIRHLGTILKGKTLAVVGIGAIGQRLAEMATGIGMRVIGWGRNQKPGAFKYFSDLGAALAEADYIAVTVKVDRGTDGNANFVNAEFLHKAKPGAVLINHAGGELLNLDDIHAALQNGSIGGFITPTKWVKPHPLADDERVIHLPLNDWMSPESFDAIESVWVGNVVSAIDGKPLNLFN